jgi:hypothetical protein
LSLADDVTVGGNFKINGTTVIDSSRNLTNIGTISSGNISADRFILPSTASAANQYIYTNNTNTGTGSLTIQSGEGSAAYGGGLVLYSHSHASKAGWVTAGISSGSGGKFSVNNQGIGGGTDVFTVDASGNTVANGTISSGTITSSGQINAGTNLVAGTSVYSNNGVYYGSTTLSLKNNTSGSFLSFAANANATFAGTISSGAITADGLTVGDNEWIYAGNGADLKIGHDGSSNIIRSQGHPLYIDSNGINFRGYSPYTNHMSIASNGDISFYNDSANQGLFWDSSTSRLGLGTTNPAVPLHVIGDIATSTRLASDTINGYTGGSTPLTIQTGGTQNIVLGTNNTTALVIDSSQNATFSGSVTATTGFTTAANTRVQASSGMLFLNGPSALTFEVGAGSEKMRLTSTGLGIGTSSPSRKVSVWDHC